MEKEWPDLLALVTHHTVMSEMLPCTLRLPHKSKNPAYKDSEDGKKEDDPDYQRLSDFTSMMAALKNWPPWFIFIYWAVCNQKTTLLFIYLFCFFKCLFFVALNVTMFFLAFLFLDYNVLHSVPSPKIPFSPSIVTWCCRFESIYQHLDICDQVDVWSFYVDIHCWFFDFFFVEGQVFLCATFTIIMTMMDRGLTWMMLYTTLVNSKLYKNSINVYITLVLKLNRDFFMINCKTRFSQNFPLGLNPRFVTFQI